MSSQNSQLLPVHLKPVLSIHVKPVLSSRRSMSRRNSQLLPVHLKPVLSIHVKPVLSSRRSMSRQNSRSLPVHAMLALAIQQVILSFVCKQKFPFFTREARSATRVLAVVFLCVRLFVRPSICPSWHLSHPGIISRPSEIDSRFSPYDSSKSLVSCEQILGHWLEGFP